METVKDAKGRYIEQLGTALDALTDYKKIERAGQMLATETYATVVPIGGTRDLGRDGGVRALSPGSGPGRGRRTRACTCERDEKHQDEQGAAG